MVGYSCGFWEYVVISTTGGEMGPNQQVTAGCRVGIDGNVVSPILRQRQNIDVGRQPIREAVGGAGTG